MDLLNIEDGSNVKKQEIIDFIDGNLNLMKKNPEYLKLYFSLLFQPKVFEMMQEEFLQHFQNTINYIVNYYEKNGAGNPIAKARYLIAVFDGVGLHYVSDQEGFPLDDVRDLLVDLL